MKSTKKFISFILSLVMAAGLCQAQAFAADGDLRAAKEYASQIETVRAMGIMNGDENGNFNADQPLTRAEFAQILTVILKVNTSEAAKENAWYFKFRDDTDNTVLTPSGGLITEEQGSPLQENKKTVRFEDVGEEHWAFDAVSKVSDLGYMIGTSQNMFSPDESVTVNQVNKTLVKLLGYDNFAQNNGGYPAGYNYVASSLKLLKGINNYGDKPILRGELCKIICNMFDVKVIDASAVTDTGVTTYEQSKKTFLKDVMEINKYEGTMTDNGVTSLSGPSAAKKGYAVIGGKTVKVSENIDIESFIGKYVEFYTVERDSSSIEYLIYVTLKEDSDDFTIDISDFVSLSDGELKYTDENEKESSISTGLMPQVIFNGTNTDSITDDEIKQYHNGTVTVLKSGTGKNYDTVVIEAYRTVYVKAVNVSDYEISDGLANSSENVIINLDPNENKNRKITYYKNGAMTEFSEIKTGDILDIAESRDAVKVIISNESKSVTVMAVGESEDADTAIFTKDNETFKVAYELENSSKEKLPDIDETAVIYFNSFGQAARCVSSAKVLNDSGILIKAHASKKGLDETNKMMVMTSSGSISTYTFKDKVFLTDENDVKTRFNADELCTALDIYKDTLITYKVDDSGLVSDIVIPLAENYADNRTDGRIGKILDSKGAQMSYVQGGFEGKAMLQTSTKIFVISDDSGLEDSEKYHMMTKNDFNNDTKHNNVIAYNKSEGSSAAEYLIIHSNESTTYQTQLKTLDMFIVTGVKYAVNSYGENVKKVTGTYLPKGSSKTPVQMVYESSTGAFDNMYATFDSEMKTPYQVKEGDIIRCFEVDYDVKWATLLYRQDYEYENNPRVKKGGFVAIKDSLLNESTGNGNPFAPNTNAGTTTANGYKIGLLAPGSAAAAKGYVQSRLLDMFAVRYRDGYLMYTNQDLSDNTQTFDMNDSRYVTESMSIPSNIVVITIKNKKIQVKPGSMSDIKTFEDYGTDCSRLIMHMYAGQSYKTIVINGSFE